jgi:hypothetical protein
LVSQPYIRFSTTLGWNSGDEIIRLGILDVFNGLGFHPATEIYNRNPRDFDPDRLTCQLEERVPDHVVFAGSPEWWQECVSLRHALRSRWPLRRLLRAVWPGRAEVVNGLLLASLLRDGTPCSFVGVGSSRRPFIGPQLRVVLDQQCRLLTVRDQQTADVLAPWSPTLLPCPAMFAGEWRQRSEIGRFGLILQAPNRGLIAMSRAEIRWIESQVGQLLASRPDTEFVAHTPGDSQYLRARHPGIRVHDAFTGEDLVRCLAQFDMLASTRLHGCILACGLGIPVYQLHYGLRMDALDLFPVLNRRDHGDLVEAIQALDVARHSEKLRAFREQTRSEYVRLLEPWVRSLRRPEAPSR